MAVQTITANTNLDAIAAGAWRAGDTLTINNGAVVTVNTSQDKTLNGVTISNGKLRIENTSTTTPLVFRMGNTSATAPAITPANGLGSIEIAGNWIELGTGDGTANQAFTLPFDFHCAALWVETAPASGVYRPWSNILRTFPNVDQEWLYEGWDSVGNGIRGYAFKQTPTASPVFHTVQTNCTTATSRIITMTSTAGIKPGAVVIGSSFVVANTVVERVLNATQIEVNLATTGNSSAVTITIYNTHECWTSNQVVFGDGINGNVVPNGCKVRVPNIVLTCCRGINLETGGNGLNINLTNGGMLTADTCLFSYSNNTFTTPQSLSLKRVGFSFPQAITKCYGLTIDDVLISVPPLFPYLTSNRFAVGYQLGVLTWSYLAGTINNLYFYSNALYATSPYDSSAQLSIQYCDSLVVSNLHIQQPMIGYNGAALALYFSNRCVLDNITLIGGSTRALNLYSSNENKITNLTYGHFGFTKYHASPQVNNGFNLFAHDINGNTLTNDQPYYLKHRRLHAMLPGVVGMEASRTLAFVPFQSASPYMVKDFGVSVASNSVALYWDDRRNSVTPSTVFRVYRSTTEGCPVRDGTTLLTSITNQATVTYLDSTAVNGTTYWYVLRKYLTTDLLTYEDTPAVPATPAADAAYQNYMTQSQGYNDASWTKSGVTIPSSADMSVPFSQGIGTRYTSGRRAQVTAANGTLTKSVTGLTIGLQYTASIWVRFQGACRNADAAVLSTPMRLTWGTAFLDFTATPTWQRKSVTFTATATSHNFILQFNTSGEWVDLGNAQVNLGATALADILTTTAAVTAATFAPTEARAFSSMTPDDSTAIIGVFMPTEVIGGGYQSWQTHIGTTPGFTPSASNLLMAFGTSFSTIKISTSSSRNVLRNITQDGTGDRQQFLELTISSSDNIIENVTIEPSAGYYNNATTSGFYANLQTDANRNILKNWSLGTHFEYNANSRTFLADNTANGNVLQNWRAKKGLTYILPYNNDMLLKGVSGGACQNDDTLYYGLTPLNSVGGTGITFTGIYDTHFAELYHTQTTGALHVFFTASTKDTPPYEINGTAVFSNTGLLYFQAPGDSITYTWPHKIYGVSGFQNIAPIWLSNDLSAGNTAGLSRERADSLLFEFQIDTGSGYSAWTEATAANLSAVSVSASSGFNLKLRMTARQFIRYTGQSVNFTEGMIIRQQTSGATARVVKDFDYGPDGLLVVDSITGTWTDTAALDLLRDSDGATMTTGTTLVNGFVFGPSNTSYVRGLKIFTNVDQTALYPESAYYLYLSGLPNGTEVRVRQGSHTLAHMSDVAGGTYAFGHSIPGRKVKIQFTLAGYSFDDIEWVLTAADTTLPVTYSPDPSYTPS